MKGSGIGRLDWLLAFVLTLSGAARAPAQNAPPIITAQPPSQTVSAASVVTFRVTVTGTEPLFYQWRKDGTNLANGGKFTGATAATLTVSNVQGSEMGYYSVVVTNADGSVTSSHAALALWPAVAWGYNDFGQSTVPSGLTNVTAFVGGYYHSVALKADGAVVAWGRTNYGQARVPAEATNGLALAAGAYHSLVLRADGRVVAWGDNRAGQASVPADLSNVVAVAAGEFHSLALKADGRVVAWGTNDQGQTSVPLGLENVVAIAAGGSHNLVLQSDGRVVAWGNNASGQTNVPAALSNVVAIVAGYLHNVALKADGTVAAWGQGTYGQTNLPIGLVNVVAIAAGRRHGLALKADGTLVAWGNNNNAQTNIPLGLTNLIAIAAGYFHNLVLQGDGRPCLLAQPLSRTVAMGTRVLLSAPAMGVAPLSYQWQFNGTDLADATNAVLVLPDFQPAQAGAYRCVISNPLGTVMTEPVAVLLPGAPPLILVQPEGRAVPLGTNVSFSVVAYGSGVLSYQWELEGVPVDENWRKQGAQTARLTITNVLIVDGGGYRVRVSNAYGAATSAVACLSVPNVVSWGSDFWGTTGVPADATNVVAVSGRYVHALALRRDGTVVGWGAIRSSSEYVVDYGQVQVPAGLSNVMAVAAGGFHSLALLSNGTVVAWGAGTTDESTNQCDSGHWQRHFGQSMVPASLSNVVGVAAGHLHSVALKRDGTVVAWGANKDETCTFYFGQGTVPAGLSEALAVDANYYNTLALKRDGTVLPWGYAPAAPAGLSNVVAIGSGHYHGLALRKDRTVAAWGTGDAADVPPGLRNVVAIAAGGAHNLALLDDGQVVAWGANGSGQSSVPAGLANVTAIGAGMDFSLAVVDRSLGFRPWIAVQPTRALGTEGGQLTLHVEAEGTQPLSYQWQWQGTNLPGATQATLVLTNLSGAEAGVYRVTVSGPQGKVASDLVVVSVEQPLGEALDNTELKWTSGGDARWGAQTDQAHDGVDAARSGEITHSEQSFLQTEATGPGTLTFWWKTSSEAGYDVLSFYRDGVLEATRSGETDWEQQTCYLGAARQTLTWVYAKNGIGDAGQDAAWVDQVSVVPGGTTPTVLLSAANQYVSAGRTVTWSVSAVGTPPLRYQWHKSVVSGQWSVVSGATNASLTLMSVSWDQAGSYRAVVMNDFGTATSAEATLEVKVLAPVITAQPESWTGSAGLTVTVRVVGQGVPPPQYQWFTSVVSGQWSVVSGATNAVLTLATVQPGQTGDYQVVLSNVAGVVTSAVARVEVVDPPTILEPPQGQSVYAGSNVTFRVTALGRVPLAYQWQFNGENLAGATEVMLVVPNAQQVQAGSYQVVVSNVLGAVTSAPVTLTVIDGPPVITGPPESQAVPVGSSVTFSVTALGTASLSYQWHWNGTNLAGATGPSLTLSNVQLAMAGLYGVRVGNAYGTTPSAEAGLTVLLPVLNLHDVWRYDRSGACRGTEWRALVYNDSAWPSGPGLFGYDDSDWDPYGPYGEFATPFPAPQSQSPFVVTYYFRTRFVFTNNPASVSLIAYNLIDDSAVAYLNGVEQYRFNMPAGTPSCITMTNNFINATEGFFVWTNFGPQNLVQGTNALAVEVHQCSSNSSDIAFGLELLASAGPGAFLSLPEDPEAFLFSTVSLEAAVGGSPPLSYQWQFQGTNLPGATSPTLTLANFQTNQAGTYRLLVNNPYGTVASRDIVLRPRLAEVVGWGDNNQLQTQIPLKLSNVVAIAAEQLSSLALQGDGTVVGWGFNGRGEVNIPRDLSNVVAIAAGRFHGLALKADGTVTNWGIYILHGNIPVWVPAGLSNVMAVAGNEASSIALKKDGTVVVWGGNAQNPPRVPEGLRNVVAIDAEGYHCLALKSDGTVITWTTLQGEGYPSVPASPPSDLSNAVAIATGLDYSLALRSDGRVVAWGDIRYGQCNVPSDLTNAVAIAAYEKHSLALRADGTVVAWGDNSDGQGNVPPGLADVVAIDAGLWHSLALVNKTHRALIAALDAPTLPWTVSGEASWFAQSAVTHDGQQAAQSAPITHEQQSVLHTTMGGPGVVQFYWKVSSETNYDTLRFLINGVEQARISGEVDWQRQLFQVPAGVNRLEWVYAKDVGVSSGQDAGWVDQVAYAYGQFVEPRIESQPASQVVGLGTPATFSVGTKGLAPLFYQWLWNGAALSGKTNATLTVPAVRYANAGDYSVIVSNRFGVVTSDEATLAVVPVAAWGADTYGQCTLSPLLMDAVLLASGYSHSLALLRNGSVLGWGHNGFGQCNAPAGLQQVVALAGGAYHSLALQSDGRVVGWGQNTYGQARVPSDLSNVVAIAAGGWHSLALVADGTVVAWGNNSYGQITVPSDLAEVVAVAGGAYHSLALRADGVVVVWGDNQYGQGEVPAEVTDVIAIACGHYHNLALRADGTVVAWGNNWYGQTEVPAGLSNVVAIAAGGYHNQALLADGTVVGWGNDYYDQSTPPAGLANIVQLAAGDVHSLALIGDGSPVLTLAPRSQSVVLGNAVSLQTLVAGAPPVSYQWHRSVVSGQWSVVSGATNSLLRFQPAGLGDSGEYVCVVSNALGLVTSQVAQLTVLVPPSFEPLPGRVSVVQGSNVTFTVTATGTPPLRYQWRKNGENIPGATNSSFTILNVQTSDGGAYSVVVANVVTAVISEPSVLVVEVLSQAPPEDHFVNRRVLTGTNGFAAGTNLFATREPGEPLHAGQYGSNSVWYSWTAPARGIATFRTVGSTFDTLLAVYIGNDLTALTAVASDEDAGGFFTSQVRFNAVANTEYQIAIDGLAGEQGHFLLQWALEATAAQLPEITSQPASATVAEAASHTFCVTATGTGLRYQWSFLGQPIPGATEACYTVVSVQAEHVGTYRARVSDGVETVESLPATLEIGPMTGVQSQDKPENLITGSGGAGGLAKGAVQAGAGAGGLATIPVTMGTTDSQVMNNTGDTTQARESTACGVIGGSSRWLSLKPNTSGTLVLDTTRSTIDTVLAVYRAAPDYSNPFTFWATLVPVACDDNGAPDGVRSLIRLAAEAGTNYMVAVDGVNGTNGIIRLNWALGRAPLVASGPMGLLTVGQGQEVTWSVTVTNNPRPRATYQWQRDLVDLPEATNATLTLSNVQVSDNGEYGVVVSNAIGVVRAYVGTLVVEPVSERMVGSGFDADVEEWTVMGEGFSLNFQGQGGNPGGHLLVSGPWGGRGCYCVAPRRFLGNQAGAYAGWLKFDLKRPAGSLPLGAQPDVVLRGGGVTLVYVLPPAWGTNWTDCLVPLREGQGWLKDTVGGPAPTREELLTVLGALEAVQIRGEVGFGGEGGGLDNLSLEAAVPVLLQVERVSETSVVLTWPVWERDCVLERCVELGGNWTAVGESPVVSNGLRQLTVTITSGHAFFRLSKPGP